MKIRINGNTIRLRLSQTEIYNFVHSGIVTSSCQFTNTTLHYQIIQDDVDNISADFTDGTIAVYVPKELVKHWDTDDRVGFEYSTPDGLYILIEKDFQCLKPRPNEDESDLFTNPQSTLSSYD